MPALTIAVRCVVGGALGSCPGFALIAIGRVEQGIGVAIIGGCLGIVLALARVLYDASIRTTLWRGLLLFCRITAAKNIPGGGELIPIDLSTPVTRLAKPPDAKTWDERITFGMTVGGAVAIIPGLLMAYYIRDRNPEPIPWFLDVLQRGLIAFIFIVFVGGGCGGTFGGLTVPGVHRRNVLLGTMIGLILGAGVATAIVPGAKAPAWHVYAFSCGAFAWLGMACGMFSGDNFEDTDAGTS